MSILCRVPRVAFSVAALLFSAVFMQAPAAAALTLQAIDVTPINPSIEIGETQAFAATGIYSDGSTQPLLRPVALFSGLEDHSCVVMDNGEVQCWGENRNGQLGDGTTEPSSVPVTVVGISSATTVATGDDHSCALLASGEVQCWGDNGDGQLGDGTGSSSSVPVTVFGISTATAVAVGDEHSCAVLASGEVQCWGYNGYGQLGNGTRDESDVPVTVAGITTATAIGLGQVHSCAALASGAVQCWGSNGSYQLGQEDDEGEYFSPVAVGGISTAVAVVAGYRHSCALLASGSVHCWGYNSDGQLGDGTTNTAEEGPVTVVGISTAEMLAAGGYHTCAQLAGGSLNCWGDNARGQLGDGSLDNSTVPVAVAGISTAIAVAAGAQHSCALLANGATYCWGQNWYGQLGNGTFPVSTVPVGVSGISTATAPAAAFHTCVLLDGGEVQCWGYNGYGQLGDGTMENSSTPVTVSGITTATSVVVGFGHSCGLLAGGEVQCWGRNEFGQLGNDTQEGSSTPVTVSGISTATAVAAGRSHSCAVLADGAVRCWGWNNYGQLGDGASGNGVIALTPVTVIGVTTATAVTAGERHSCALLDSGEVSCWGFNHRGQLGDGNTGVLVSPPVLVSGISTAVSVSTSDNHTCALLDGGAVQCWGTNEVGELGDGTMVDSSTPVTVSDITTATAVVAGPNHSCAVLSGGTMQCWGYGDGGQLGNGATGSGARFSTPVTVNGISTAVVPAAGQLHSCAVLTGGAMQCWGSNLQGQLGNGVTGQYPTPQPVSGLPGITWSSDNTAVASIDVTGVATGVASGDSLITVTVGDVAGDTVLTVVGGSVEEFVETASLQALDVIAALPETSVTNGGNRVALQNDLLNVLKSLENDPPDMAKVRRKLEAALEVTDGCALRGTPDMIGGGRSSQADTITNCADQLPVYTLLIDALDALSQ